jgi:Zn-dependent protease with chaperone function
LVAVGATNIRNRHARDLPKSVHSVLIRLKLAVGLVAIVVGVGVALVAWWLGIVVALAVGFGAWFGLVAPRVRNAEDRALLHVGPSHVAGEHATTGELRLLNLVEGLAPNAGLPRPRCLVVDDPAANALALGRDSRHGCLVVTSGLLDSLSRMELEAVVAYGLVRLRGGDTAAPTLTAALGGGGWFVGHAVGSQPDADLAAVSLTCYPPGLIGALETIGAQGPATPASAAADMAPLWIAAPGDTAGLATRVAALEEL